MTIPARRTPSRAIARTSPRTPRTGAESTGTVRSTPVRPHLWVVPDGEPTRRPRLGARGRRAPFVLFLVALLVGTTLGLLFLNTTVAVDSLKATQLRTENAQREKDVQRLEQQVVNGSTPEELAREAAIAGMVPAGPPAYLVIQPDGSSTVRGTPEPAPAAAPPSSGSPPASPSPAPSPSSAPPSGSPPSPAPSPSAPSSSAPSSSPSAPVGTVLDAGGD